MTMFASQYVTLTCASLLTAVQRTILASFYFQSFWTPICLPPLPERQPVRMTSNLSVNWKKLKAEIKQESTRKSKKRSLEEERETPRSENRPKTGHHSQKGRKMGNSHTSKVEPVTKRGESMTVTIDPQLRTVTLEEIADVHRLGFGKTSIEAADKERINEGAAPSIEPGKFVALDCEMVGVGPGGFDSALARVSIVDFHGRQVYDSFVRPGQKVTNWRTEVSGVTPRHMKNARPFNEVQEHIRKLIKDRIVVGHDLSHDFDALKIKGFSYAQRRDTAHFKDFKKFGAGRKPQLKVLSKAILEIEVQAGHHSSIEDARIAMALFKSHKQAFDIAHMDFNSSASGRTTSGNGKKNGKKNGRPKKNGKSGK